MTREIRPGGETRASGGATGSAPSFAEAKQTFEGILSRINSGRNDVHNANLWALENGGRAEDVSSAIKLDRAEVRKLSEELAALPAALGDMILTRVLPERMKQAQHGSIFLSRNAASDLNALAQQRGLAVRFEALEPVLPLATPVMPGVGPSTRPSTSAIEGVAAISEIRASAPVDPALVARINEISSLVIAKEAGKGKNVLASVVNILDMIAPVAVSLLPATGDDAATKELKQSSIKAMKKDLKAEHLSDQEFIHQLQVIHAQLLQYKGMITLGNEIAVDSGKRLRPEVEEAVKKGFDTVVSSLPMKSAPEAAASKMNESIEAATTVWGPPEEGSSERKKIKDGLKDVVKPDFVQSLDAASISTFTALLDWLHVFDEAKTEERDVKSADGSTQRKKLMTLETGWRENPATHEHEEVPKLLVAESNRFVFVRLPYDDKIDRSNERSFGPPRTKIYRLIGAPSVNAQNRHAALSNMVRSLPQNDPLEMDFRDRDGKVIMPRVQAEGEADPFALLAHAGVNASAWAFPLLDGDPVQFTKGIHKGAAEDTEKGTIVQFVTVGGLESLSIDMDPRFELRGDVPYYNAIVVELTGPGGEALPLKVAEWTVENFADTKDPTSNR